MADFGIEVQGARQLQEKFNKYIRTSPGTFDKTTGRWAKQTAGQLGRQSYPARRAGQTYVRTKRLKRGYRAKRIQSSVWQIFNLVRYAGFVVGQFQAWMHKGRWWQAQDKVNKRQPKLIKALRKDIQRILG